MSDENSRRVFLRTMGLAAAGLAAGVLVPRTLMRALSAGGSAAELSALRARMPLRALGKTGHKVSLFSLGGQGAIEWRLRLRPHVARRIIERALDLGVNYIDTAPSYGNGLSEERIGEVLRTRRNEVFLATKTGDRTYDGTLRLAEQSLKRLRTDRIDLYQLHDIRTHDALGTAFSRDGAVRAMERLRSEGVVRYLGITGHTDPQVLLRGIEEYPFDAILMSLNAGDIHYKPFQKELLQTAVRKEMGIIAMKITARDRLLHEGGLSSMEDAMGYVMSFPVSSALIGVTDINQLEENARIARDFRGPYSAEQLAAIETLTQPYSEDANWFKIRWG